MTRKKLNKAAREAARRKRVEDRYRKAADRLHGRDGELEIDVGAPVSMGGDGRGAYVQAWVWVYKSELKPEDR